MSTAPAPAAVDQAVRPDVAHLRCHICYPVFELGVTKAVCGHLFGKDVIAPPSMERCVVCQEMEGRHFVMHFVNGEIPLS